MPLYTIYIYIYIYIYTHANTYKQITEHVEFTLHCLQVEIAF